TPCSGRYSGYFMEIEAKFAIPDVDTFEKLGALAGLGDYALTEVKVKQIHDTYFDTTDRRIWQAGYAFRCREQTGGVLMTLKALAGGSGVIRRREELEVALPAAQPLAQWPPCPARDRLQELIGERAVTPLFDLRQTRHVRMLTIGGRAVAELSLDEVRLQAPGREEIFFVLEVELTAAGDEAELAVIVESLQSAWGLQPDPRSKLERAQAFFGVELPLSEALIPPATPGIKVNDSMAEAARKTFLFHFRQLLVHEPGVRRGEDIEALHDMRVATRRMRVAARIFAKYLDSEATRPFKAELKRTGGVLGNARDLDVFWEKAASYQSTFPEDERPALSPLRAAWEAARRRAQEQMLSYLDGSDYQHFKETFGAYLQTSWPDVLPLLNAKGEPAPHRVRHVAPALIARCLADLRAYDEWFQGPDVPLRRYHRLRITSKRLRYTLEYFREVLGPGAQALIDEIKQLQDHLGDLQDAVVAGNILRDFLAWGTWGHTESEIPPHPIVAPGVAAYLTARQTELQRQIETFPELWGRYTSREFSLRVADVTFNL
ncbi:MAG: CHAD domain-containing protein, partial [Chloroflexota bacterium]|nr:CHAD domain-containing protein [Chloroflexota bacterium]